MARDLTKGKPKARDLTSAARRLIKTLDVLAKRIDEYGAAALALGRDKEVSPDGATARGFDARQVRWRIKAEVTARLSPKHVFGQPAPWLVLDGAPEARRYIVANPLPGSV